jgi:hypothetical protein
MCDTIPSLGSQSLLPPAGSWGLLPGRALSLHPRGSGRLTLVQGRAWLTVSAAGQPSTDMVLHAGECVVLPAHSHAGVVFHSDWHFQSPEKAARLGAARRQWWCPCQALQRRWAAFSGLPSGQWPRGHLRCCSGLT